jgi:type II secretory pathway pseudopilin PulG
MSTAGGAPHPQDGTTFLEVLVAAMLIGLALAPLMQLYPGILAADQEADVEMRVGVAALRKMEELIAALRDDIAGAASGAENCPDFPGCRLSWTIATEVSSAVSGVGELKTVNLQGCADANGNLACDSGEVQVRFDAKVTSRP